MSPQNADALNGELPFCEKEPFFQFGESFSTRQTGDLQFINARHLKLGMREFLRQIAVIRDNQQALARLVEPADGEQSGFVGWNQIDGADPATRIIIGT